MSTDTMENNQQQEQYSPVSDSDFAFGFNKPAFSDMILKLLISDDPLGENNINSTKNRKLNEGTLSLWQRMKKITKSSKEPRVRSLHINSLILAAKSPFFHKLFTNGKMLRKQSEVTLGILSSEEEALIDVFKFMYDCNLLSASIPNDLFAVLLAAIKFNVPSCVNHCCNLLLTFPITDQLALLYIDLPSTSFIDATKPLLKLAKDFLPDILKCVSKYHKDIIDLSLDGIKIILSHDDLKMDSEDAVYDLLMEWINVHFPKYDEHCRAFKTELLNLMRLEYLSPQKLKSAIAEFSDDNHLEMGTVTSVIEPFVIDKRRASLPTRRRPYKIPPVTTMNFEIPLKQCVVFLDLKIEECRAITRLDCETFVMLGGFIFNLSVQRIKNESEQDCFGLFLYSKKLGTELTVEYEFAVRLKSSPEAFVTQRKQTCNFTPGVDYGHGHRDLFGVTWSSVMDTNSDFFINETMHLRAILTLR